MNHEEELQKLIEAGNENASGLDAKAYREVFRIASQDPNTRLSPNFADRIVTKVLAQKQKESARDLWWLGFGVFFLIVGLIVTTAVAGLQFQLGFLADMASYAGVFVFGAVFIIVLNWIDKRLVIKKHHII